VKISSVGWNALPGRFSPLVAAKLDTIALLTLLPCAGKVTNPICSTVLAVFAALIADGGQNCFRFRGAAVGPCRFAAAKHSSQAGVYQSSGTNIYW
jgi:hypothetical protein